MLFPFQTEKIESESGFAGKSKSAHGGVFQVMRKRGGVTRKWFPRSLHNEQS